MDGYGAGGGGVLKEVVGGAKALHRCNRALKLFRRRCVLSLHALDVSARGAFLTRQFVGLCLAVPRNGASAGSVIAELAAAVAAGDARAV